MATASSSPADHDAAALIRAHAFATLASGAVASALGAFIYLQLLTPGILGHAAWLGVGRLRFACLLVMLFGWLGNTLAICVYRAFPSAANLVVRWRVAGLKVGVWNFVITAPVVLMALIGLLPPTRLLTVWFALSTSPQTQVILSGLFFVPSILMNVRLRLGSTARRFDRAFAMILCGALGLMIGGIGGEFAQAAAMRDGAPWLDGLGRMHSFWIVTGFAYLITLWGCLLGCAAMSGSVDSVRASGTRMMQWFFGSAILVIVMFPVSVYFVGTLDASSTPATASERHGRGIFIREGCASCHGNEDYRGIGPDLSRESGARPADWHYAHLFSPRAVTPKSAMPSYAHLFAGAADQPTQDGRDLVAYLDSLGKAEELGAPEADAASLHPKLPAARARRSGAFPPLSGTGNRAEGLRLFAENCAGCHGPTGEGDGPGAVSLRPKPANLAAHRYTNAQLATVLWNGVAGTAMPAWRDQPLDRLAHLITAVQSLGDDGAAKRAAGDEAAPGGALEMGARVYAANCSQCHGERGGGDGFSAASLTVAPANFQRQQPSLDYALRVIGSGVEGTPMAPWTSRLGDQELLAVAHYVRSLYTGGAR